MGAGQDRTGLGMGPLKVSNEYMAGLKPGTSHVRHAHEAQESLGMYCTNCIHSVEYALSL